MDKQAVESADPADYGYADLPSRGGMKVVPNIPPEMTTCRTCGSVATDHSPGRFSIYGACPTPPANPVAGGRDD